MTTMSPVVFLKEVKQELAKVVWPTRQETIKLTMVVIIVSVIIGFFIGGIDYLFTKILEVLVAI